MLEYIRSIQKRRNDEAGASAVEYGLLVALIAAVIVVIVLSLGGIVKDAFKDTCDGMKNGNASLSGNCNT